MLRSVRHLLSTAVAWPIWLKQRSNISKGSSFQIKSSAWERLPGGVKKWFIRKILKPSEFHAVRIANADPSLTGSIQQQEKGSWAISPATLLYIWKYLKKNKPMHILEYGSGASTKLFAMYAEDMRALGEIVTVTSFDHDEKWLHEAQAVLSQAGLENNVNLVHAPLAEQKLMGKSIVTYKINPQAVCSNTSVDFCLIDGPPGTVGRIGTLPLVVPYLADGAAIFLDDAFRDGELSIMDAWHDHWPNQLSSPRLMCIDSHGTGLMHWSSIPLVD